MEHIAGQYLVVDVLLPDGRNEPRSYSLFTLPGVDDAPAIMIKKHEGGAVSTYLHDSVKPGVKLNVSSPMGKFAIAPHAEENIFFAAGSGIAPVVSLVKEALHRTDTNVTLVYVVRSDEDYFLEGQINRMSKMYPQRFSCHTWITSVRGRPSTEILAALGRSRTENPAVYGCGPDGFIKNVESAIQVMGINPENFLVEKFGNSARCQVSQGPELCATSVDSTATVDVLGIQHALRWPASEKLLDVLLRNDIRVPFSCREGICSACQCTVLEGQTVMAKDSGLSTDEKASGLSLACQLLATSAHTSVKFS